METDCDEDEPPSWIVRDGSNVIQLILFELMRTD
jgi:hypothetical protein